MRLFFAILVTLAILPGAAHAGVLATAVALLANGVSFGAALTAAFGTIGAFLVKAVIGVALSLAGQLLRDKPKLNTSGIQTEQTTTGDVTPAKFVVGRYGLEGHLVAPAYTHGARNEMMTYIMEVSNIPVTGLTGRIAIDGEWRDIDTDPANAHADYGQPILGLEHGGQAHAWIRFHDGSQTTADAMLVDKYGAHADRPWTADHVLRGTAYAVLTFRYNNKVFSGWPAVRFELDGIPLYDPRKDSTVGGSGAHRWADPATWEFTRNPQVMVYNILRGITLPTGDIYGLQVAAEDLPLDAWFAAMNECDELIGSRVKYQAGFEVDVSVEPFEVIKELNKASFTQLAQFGGVYRPRTGPPGTAVLAITDDDILVTEARELDPFPGLASTHNAVTGTWVDPGSVYQGRSADTILNSDWEAEDGDRRLTLDIGMPAVTNKSQAQHLLQSYINDDRRFRVHRIALPPSAAALEPLDAIEWTSEHNGYTTKLFEVVEVEDRLDTMIQIVTLRERDASDVDWTAADDVPDPDPLTPVSPPAALQPTLTAAPATLTDGGGTGRRPGLTLSWPADEAPEVDLLRYEIRLSSDQSVVARAVADVREGAVTHAAGLVPATAYEARAQYIQPGYPTAWSAWIGATTPDVRLTPDDIDPSTPGVPTGLTLSTSLADNGLARLIADWDDNPESHVAGYEVLITESGGVEHVIPVGQSRFDTLALRNAAFSVRVRAVSTTGGKSAPTASENITTATDSTPPAVPLNVIASAGFNTIWVEWDAVADADLSHYEVCYKDTATTPGVNPTSPVIELPATKALISGLGDAVTKHIFVRAVDTSGNKSNWSLGASATTVKIDATNLVSSLTGDIATGVQAASDLAVLDQQVSADIDAALAAQAPLGATILREPASSWTNKSGASTTSLLKAAPVQGTFLTADADFGEAYDFGDINNRTIGQAYPVDFDAGKVFKVTYRYKVVDDGTSAGAYARFGVTVSEGTTVIQSNVQSGGYLSAVADGVQEFEVYFSADSARLTEITNAIQGAITVTIPAPGAANKAYFHLRQNHASDGRIVVGSIEVRDVTDTAIAYDVLRTELQTEVNGINATLTQDYYTAAQVDSAVSAAQTTLQSQIDDNAAAISSEQTARVSGDNALASDINTLSTTVNGNTSTISQHTTSINGLSAEYMLRVDVNGQVSGMVIGAEAGDGGAVVSQAAFYVDQFAVVHPGETPVTPFYVDGGVVYIKSAVIKDASITSAKIAGLDAGKITAGTALAGSITVSGDSLTRISRGAMTGNFMRDFSTDWAGLWTDGSADASHSIVAGGAPEGNDVALVSYSGASDPNSTGTTGGVYVPIPVDTARSLSGKRVQISIRAKASTSAEFGVAYSTSSVGNSGWSKFTPEATWKTFVFYYDVPANGTGADYIGIWGDTANGGGDVLIDSVSVGVSAEDYAADPAARINSASTQIDPGKIVIDGGTSLADWRGTDKTTIDGGKIEAKSIYASKLVAVDVTNLVPDSQLIDDDSWTLPADFSWNASPDPNFNAIRSIQYSNSGNPGTGFSANVESDLFPVEQGEEYYAEFKTFNGAAAQEYDPRARILWYDSAGTLIFPPSWFRDLHQGPGGAAGIRTHSINTTAPAGAVKALFACDTDYSNTTTGYNLGDITVRKRQSGATVIKPGSLTTELVDTTDFAASGLAVFGDSLQSDNFSSGASGWQITKAGNAEFNNLVVRGWVQDGAVSNVGMGTLDGPAHYDGSDGTVHTLVVVSLGPVVTEHFWNVAAYGEFRSPDGSWFYGLRMVIRYKPVGGSWGAWSYIGPYPTNTTNTWSAYKYNTTIQGVYDDVEVAMQGSTTVAAAGTQNNVRNLALVGRALVR